MDQQEFAGFRLVAKLGAGATAEVYRAQRPGEAEVALKILHEEGITDQVRVRFGREIQALERLDHPHILKVLASGCEGERLWYAMEFSSKRNLEEVFRERHARGGILEISEVLVLARGLADSLGYLHRSSVVHRDLKPENLLVDETLRPTLMDFGLAKDMERSEMTAEGMVMGTPRYMSPEQTRGMPAGPSSDVYQVGLILYRALTGKLPLEDKSPFATAMRRMNEAIPPPSTERPGVPPGLDRILLQALRFDAGERYQEMDGFASDLARLDPRTGALLPGQSMPGVTAERAPSRPPVGEATMVTRARGPLVSSLASDTHVPDPARGPSRGLVWGLGLGLGALLGAGLLMTRSAPGNEPTPEVRGLELRVRGEEVRVYFETDVPVRSFLRLDPPLGELLPVMTEASTLHARTLEMDQSDPSEYQLLLESRAGTRHELAPAALSESAGSGGGLGLGIQERRQGDRVTLSFRTPEDSRCSVRYGPPGSLDSSGRAMVTGGTRHVFEIGPLPSGEEIRYRIQVEAGGTTRTSSEQTLGGGSP